MIQSGWRQRSTLIKDSSPCSSSSFSCDGDLTGFSEGVFSMREFRGALDSGEVMGVMALGEFRGVEILGEFGAVSLGKAGGVFASDDVSGTSVFGGSC